MFGYVIANLEGLTQAQKDRYKGCYCGLCRVLKQRHGFSGRSVSEKVQGSCTETRKILAGKVPQHRQHQRRQIRRPVRPVKHLVEERKG